MKVVKYACSHGVTNAIRFFKKQFPNLTESTVCPLISKYKEEIKKKSVECAIISERRGRPLLLPTELVDTKFCLFITNMRTAGGTINGGYLDYIGWINYYIWQYLWLKYILIKITEEVYPVYKSRAKYCTFTFFICLKPRLIHQTIRYLLIQWKLVTMRTDSLAHSQSLLFSSKLLRYQLPSSLP